jgi:hypothetical protein
VIDPLISVLKLTHGSKQAAILSAAFIKGNILPPTYKLGPLHVLKIHLLALSNFDIRDNKDGVTHIMLRHSAYYQA